MQWLVTGASGFVGGHLALRLASAGHRVFASSRQASALEALAGRHAGITAVPIDINDIANFIPSAPVDAIVHCAAISPADKQPVARMMQVNVAGSGALAEWSVKHNVKHFIHLSSISLYGEAVGQIDELSPILNPDDYGRSKLFAEQAIEEARGSMAAFSLRLPGVLGRGAKNIWLSSVLPKLLAGKPANYFNAGAPFNNAVHVDDLGRFIQRLTEGSHTGHTAFVLGAGSVLSFKELLERMKTLASSNSPLVEQPTEKPAFYIDCRGAMAHGYAPMTMDAMLEQYVRESLPR